MEVAAAVFFLAVFLGAGLVVALLIAYWLIRKRGR
jgi:hypothetical protein